MCGFDDVQRGNYFGGEPIRTEVEVRVRNHKNGKDEFMGEMIKSGSEMVVDWIWRICNIALRVV